MKRITSRQNPLVARCRAAARGELPDVLLLDGMHLISEAIAAGVRIRLLAVAADAVDRSEVAEIIDDMGGNDVESVIVSVPVMAALSPVRASSSVVALADRPASHFLSGSSQLQPAGSRGPQRGSRAGVADPPQGGHYQGDERPQTKPFLVVTIDVQDPGNLGAIVRVAEAGGATGVVVTGQSADPFGWKALRGSSGSALRVPIETIADTEHAVREIRARGCRVVATAPRNGRSFFDVDYTGATAVLIGAEGQGLPSSLVNAADERVTIPMQSPVESLNAAVAAALIVYEARRQRTETPLAVTSPGHR